MAFADIVSSFASGADQIMQVTLTDMEEAMDQIRGNIEKNRTIFEGKGVDFSVVPLTWHSAPISPTSCQLDFILGSDLLYNCANIPHLVATIRRLICESTIILLAVRWRKPAEERSFFLALSDIVEWKMIHGTCSLDFRTYGNPASQASNQYLSQTLVGCGGRVIPLAMIDEIAISQMSNAEFDEYESLQTQVYWGQAIGCPDERSNLPKRRKQ